MNENSLPRIISLSAILITGIMVWSSVFEFPNKNEYKASVLLSYNNLPKLQAHAFLVKVIGDSKPLMAQREWRRLAPASLTKIMTAVLAAEELNPFERIEVSKEAKNTEEKLSPVKIGEKITRDDIIKMMLVGSANDAALVLAEAMGGSRGENGFKNNLQHYSELARAKALEMGLTNTSFKNPVGFDDAEHFSTAEDLAKLAEYVWVKHPEIWDFSKSIDLTVYSENGNEYTLKNTNKLLSEFPAILGSKTGFTENAKESLLMFYPVRPDKVAIIVILGSNDREKDGRQIINWLENIK